MPAIDPAAGSELTVTIAVWVKIPHAPVTIYDITVVPAASPLTTAVLLPMVAMAILLLAHTPPGDASVNVAVAPVHTVNVPVIAGRVLLPALTVTI